MHIDAEARIESGRQIEAIGPYRMAGTPGESRRPRTFALYPEIGMPGASWDELAPHWYDPWCQLEGR